MHVAIVITHARADNLRKMKLGWEYLGSVSGAVFVTKWRKLTQDSEI